MSAITFKEKDIDSFFKTPFEIYPKDFPAVSQLKGDLHRFLNKKNPLFPSENDFSYFTAFKNGKISGRITAHIHQASNKLYNQKRCYFGYFDCINDLEVAAALLKKAEDFAKTRGCDELAGNFSLTAMQMAGVVTKIYINEQYSDQVFTPLYIADLLRELGYEEFFPMSTYENVLANMNEDMILGPKQKAIMESSDWTFDQLKHGNFKKIIEDVRFCLNDGFKNNPMFVPLTKEELMYQAADLMMVVDRHLSIVAYYQGRPAGTLVCIPNLNPFLKAIGSKMGITAPYHLLKLKMNRESAVGIFYSVCQEFQDQGLNGLMMYKILKALKDRGYKKLGGTWIADENVTSRRQTEKLGFYKMHDLKLFRKQLT